MIYAFMYIVPTFLNLIFTNFFFQISFSALTNPKSMAKKAKNSNALFVICSAPTDPN